MKIIGKIKINFKLNQFLNKNVWKSFKNENFIRKSKKASSITYGHILRKTLNKEQIVEFDLIKKLSEKFIIDNQNFKLIYTVIYHLRLLIIDILIC
jgi:hypothetical protein